MQKSGKVDSSPVAVDGTRVRAWFCPGRGDKLAHRIAKAIGTATRRVRIASPVISSGPILGTLAQVATDGKVDLAGVVDATQVHEVIRQWHLNGNASVEGAAAPHGAHARAVLGQALDAVRARAACTTTCTRR